MSTSRRYYPGFEKHTLSPVENTTMNATIRSLAGFVMGLGILGTGALARGQDGPPIPKPTAEHERLAKDAGTWDATIKSWTQGPGSEPSVSRGVEVAKVMPGGLWLLSSFEGKVGDLEFHGAGQTGYDPKKGKYVGTWVDSMASEIMVMEGGYDSKNHTLIMSARGTDPASGKPYDARMTNRYEGDDTRVFTMEMKSEETKGEYIKLLEITYKRRSK
jgi:hypothetical protein